MNETVSKAAVAETPVAPPAGWNWHKILLRAAALLVAFSAFRDQNHLDTTEELWTFAVAFIIFAFSCKKS